MDLSTLKQINEQKTNDAVAKQRHNELLLDNTETQQIIVKSIAKLVEFLDKKVTRTEVVNQLKQIGTPDVQRVVKAVDSLHDTLKTHENTDLTEVTKLLNGMLDQLGQLPKELPKTEKQQFVDYSSQLKSLETTIKGVETAVKAQKTTVEAPVVNVDAPVVNVDAPNLKPIEKSVSDGSKLVVKAVNAIKLPELNTDPVEKLLKKTNKLLEELPDLMPTGGGGGGSSWVAVDDNGVPVPIQLDSGVVPTSLSGGSTILFAPISASSSGDNAVVAGVTSKKIKVLSVALVSSGTVSVKWRSNTTDLSGAMPLVANSGFVLPASSPGQGNYFETVAGQALNINLSGAVAVSGHISYYVE